MVALVIIAIVLEVLPISFVISACIAWWFVKQCNTCLISDFDIDDGIGSDTFFLFFLVDVSNPLTDKY